MPSFVPNKEHVRTALLLCFNLKKTAAESHRMLVDAYGDSALSATQCKVWFRRFKDGDFDVTDKAKGGPPKKYEDADLQALLDVDDAQTQTQLADQLGVSQKAISNRLQEMGKIQKVGRWVPRELNERQMERRKSTCDILLARYKRKSFLHRIVTGDEMWIARPNCIGWKTMLCVWWDQKGIIYYELLEPGEEVTTARYQQQLIDLNRALLEKRPEYQKRQHKVIFLHDNAPSHTARYVGCTQLGSARTFGLLTRLGSL